MRSWTFPTFDRLVGPKELADVVIDFRQWYFKQDSIEAQPAPSDNGLRTLLQIAFHASLLAEEGSYTRTRLFVYRGGGWQPRPRIVAELNVWITSDDKGVQALKRLAPIADSFDSALVLEEEGDDWRCIGLATLTERVFPVQIGRPELHQYRQAPAGLSIRINGPGLLRVTDLLGTLVLHGGRIYQASELFYAPPVRELLYQMDLALTHGKDIRRYLGTDGRTHQSDLPIEFALSRIVAKMREAGKGGALIFPTETNTKLIDFGFSTTGADGLGNALHAFYLASRASAAAKAPEELRAALAEWQNSHQMILRMADHIASLSKVDGCVVLNPSLEVVAFGAKIKAPSQSGNIESALTLVNPFTREPESDVEIMRLGTRHRSAYSLCCRLPGTTAIVVSQDGDIRVFSSDSEHLYFVDSLEASSIGLPLF